MTAAGPSSNAQLIMRGTRVLEELAELAAGCDVTEAVRAAGGA